MGKIQTQSVLSGRNFVLSKIQDILKLLILNVQTCGCTMVKLAHDACQQVIKIQQIYLTLNINFFNLNPKQDIIFVGLTGNIIILLLKQHYLLNR
jgi:uncharacterized protein YfbU (UPF0304 family)